MLVLHFGPVAPLAWARDDMPCNDDYTLVDPALLNPVFSANFDISISWDISEPGHGWNLDSLRLFADHIIDEYPDNNEDLVNRLVEYFSEDLDPSYEGITVSSGAGVYEHFHICLREDVGEIFGGGNRITIANIVSVSSDENRTVTTWELARESFAHEWQHVTHEAIAAGPKFNGFTGTNEFMSKAAEILAGMRHMWPVHDIPYARAFLGGKDYYSSCIDNDHADHKYGSFALFGAYIMSHFKGSLDGCEDDLLHRWLNFQVTDIFGNLVNDITMESLAELLGDSQYDGYFEADSGPDRLAELFHEFVLSLYVNSAYLRGETSLWADGLLPQEQYQLFRSVNAIDCADDARSLPLVKDVGTEAVHVEGPIYPSDIYDSAAECDSGYDSLEFPRYPQVSTYGACFIPLVAEPGLDGDLCYDLNFDLHLEEQYYCVLAGREIDALPSPNLVLNISALGYPQARDSLDLRGAEAEELSCESYSLADLPQDIHIQVPCFASRWQSVVFVMTVTEIVPSGGFIWNKIYPFSYEAVARETPSPEMVFVDEDWGGHETDICLDRDLTISDGSRLTIAGGSNLWLAHTDIEIEVEGILELAGSSIGAIWMGPTRDDGSAWDGIKVRDGGTLIITGSTIKNAGSLSIAEDSQFIAKEIHWDADDYGCEIDLAGHQNYLTRLVVEGCRSMRVVGGNLDSCLVFGQGLEDRPLLELGPEPVHCRHSRLVGARRGIQVVGSQAELGPGLRIQAMGPSDSCAVGLCLDESASCQMEDVLIQGFATGISLDHGASCSLRNSTLRVDHTGIRLLSRAGSCDLGKIFLGSGDWGNNNILSLAGSAPFLGVENLSPHQTCAQMNFWGTNEPGDALFSGAVIWQPFALTECLPPPMIPIAAAETSQEAAMEFLGAWPNPFNPRVTIAFEVPAAGQHLTLRVFDISGRLVASSDLGSYPAGSHTWTWEAKDNKGRCLPSGVYFARIKHDGKSHDGSIKLMLLR